MKSRIGPAVDMETEARARSQGPESEATRGGAMAPAAAVPRAVLSPSWRAAWIIFGVAFIAVLVMFRKTVAALTSVYLGNATFNHGFLILPIVGYLIWLRREALAQQEPRPTAWAVVPLVISLLGWLAGYAGGVDQVEQLGLLGVSWSLFLGVFGFRVVRELVFPLFYAVFAVPFGDFLVGPLQDLTAIMAVKGIDLVGIPVYSDGLLISIPPGNFEVAEACAGLRFLIATIALGFLFSYLTFKSLWRRVAFLLLCVVVPIFANGVRAWGIIFLGYESDMTVAVGFDHIIYGWIFFAIVTAVLLVLGMSFRDRPIGEISPPVGSPDLAPPASRTVIAAFALALVALCAVGPAYAGLVINRAMPHTTIVLTPPSTSNGWRLAPSYRDDWKPNFETSDATLLRTYVKNDSAVHVFVAFYRTQDDGHEVVNFNNRVYDDKTWMRIGSGRISATVEGAPLTVEYTRILRSRAGRLVWSWHWVDGSYTSDPYRAKWLETKAKLFGGERAAAEIVIAADYRETPAEAAAVLQDFLNSVTFRPPLARASGR
jgi:exosortase A